MFNIKNLDRLVALFMVAFFVGYIYLSYNFHLLAFEEMMRFRPDTMPRGIGILGLILSSVVLISAKGEDNADNHNWKNHDYKKLIGIVIAMVIFATILKPAGFVVATTAFVIAGAIILGERDYIKLSVIALIGSISIWLIVDKLLGIYLYPIPAFITI